ncbi:OX-2 membrane glycoprotein [Liparis tanakae]|uniref:OX-2 membrane glycoprotein n=1 Tax=Liparis tanakae TaxID=230148 RepID=A0A4Z2IU76_9TELE|nr:OX-2 membrane glycoprotein [Liparis tanakae]
MTEWKLHFVLLLPLSVGFGIEASRSQISGYGSKTAVYGGDAHYSCSVANTTGVIQVTWQRIFKGEVVENLATYSQRFGQHVNDPYKEKVTFTEASLGSTSIALRNVTWGDESCYVCSFNVFPEGSKRKQTCLTVQGISEVKTEVEQEDEKVAFRCSATGKPAPTIGWAFSPGATPSDPPQSVIITNSDHTFTSSGNVTLHAPTGGAGHADCLLNDGEAGQRRERIPFSLPDGKEEEEGKGLSSARFALVIVTVLLISSILVAAAMTRHRLKAIRRKHFTLPTVDIQAL